MKAQPITPSWGHRSTQKSFSSLNTTGLNALRVQNSGHRLYFPTFLHLFHFIMYLKNQASV